MPVASGAAAAPPVIALREFSRAFRRPGAAPVQALKRVSLEVEADRFVSLVGPSGCGKTTLLRLMNGLLAPDSGEVLVNGAPPTPGPRYVSATARRTSVREGWRVRYSAESSFPMAGPRSR